MQIASLQFKARAGAKLADVKLQAALRKLAPGPWPQGGPVTMDAAEFYGLPDEIGLRVLDRIVGWAGDEGPVELAKLEAFSAALRAAMGSESVNARFRRTLAGAVLTLSRGLLTVETAPPRRHRSRGIAGPHGAKKPDSPRGY